jgi:hypothetical protein
MTSKLKTSAIAVAIALTTILSGCGDDTGKPEQMPEQAKISAERDAGKAAERLKKLPWRADLEAPAVGDRSEYLEISEPFVAYTIYHGNRTWDESADDIAESIVYVGSYENVPQEITDMHAEYAKEQNAFKKADLAKKISSWTTKQVEENKGNRLVRLGLSARDARIAPYNMESKTFQIQSGTFSEKTEEEAAEVYRNRRSNEIIKSFYYSVPQNYKFSLNGTSSLRELKVEDEATARIIEDMRQDGMIIVYGYANIVLRPHTKGKGNSEHYVDIKPQFVDFLKDGKVVYTHKVE